jgi:hypothetical protein
MNRLKCLKMAIRVTDAECLGHPTTATTAENAERATELILQDRRMMVNKNAKQLNISIWSAYCGAR